MSGVNNFYYSNLPNSRKIMGKVLLISVFFVIFTSTIGAQQLWQAQVCIPDTVATIYIIQFRGEQVVKCLSFYDIKEVQAAVIEFFNAVLYPNKVQRNMELPFKTKKT